MDAQELKKELGILDHEYIVFRIELENSLREQGILVDEQEEYWKARNAIGVAFQKFRTLIRGLK